MVAIDIDTSEFAVADDTLTATGMLLARNPAARLWLERKGFATAVIMHSPRRILRTRPLTLKPCIFVLRWLALGACQIGKPVSTRSIASPNPAAYSLGPILHQNLLNNLSQWHIEAEQPAAITLPPSHLTLQRIIRLRITAEI